MHLNKTFRKNIKRSITNSMGRYIAIILIILLGVGFLAGLELTNPVMLTVEKNFVINSNFYDFRLLSTIGFDSEDIKKISEINGINVAHGSYTSDFIMTKDETDYVYRAHLLLEDINMVSLKDGRMPESADECLVDVSMQPSFFVGDYIEIANHNEEDTKSAFKYVRYKVVGTCYSPLYMSVDRGTTAVGNGTLNGFVMIPESGFSFDYYSEAYVTTGTSFEPYSKEYEDYIDNIQPNIETQTLSIVESRFDAVYSDAQAEINDAQNKLDEESKAAKEELDAAKEKLVDGKKKLDSSEKELLNAKTKLDTAKIQLDESAAMFAENPSSWEAAIKEGKNSLAANKKEFETATKKAAADLEEANQRLISTKSMLDNLKQLIDAGMATDEQLATYQAVKEQYETGLIQYNEGLKQLEENKKSGKEKLAKFEKGIKEFETGVEQYYIGKKEYESSVEQLDSAKADYEDGLKEYENGVSDYEKEINDAQIKIDEAKAELEDLKRPSAYALDRSYNTGYSTFQNDAAIVDKIAMILPVFFFLIAALVCSTTMGRMVDDDRSLIGTMNAIGYGKREIYTKYIIYAGSAATIGTLIGYFGLGYLFPQVIWISYRMLYKIPGTVVIYDVGLFFVCLIVAWICSVGVTLVALNSHMKSMPAELIRPKAPAAGKRILLEKIGFIWKRLKFLHKVTMRNIFRFKKRMFMMILGIAGCTGLIITGFGIYDSVADICDYQFGEIMQYDITMQTTDTIDDDMISRVKEVCGDNLEIYADAVMCSADVIGKDASKSVYIIATDQDELYQMIHLMNKDKTVEIPETGKAVITEKIRNLAGIDLEDEVEIAISDTKRSRIQVVTDVDNYVYNYLYISKESYQECFGEYEPKTIYIKLKDTTVDTQIGADIANLKGVSSVTVTSSFKSIISKMMQSLNYVITLVVISAAALAFVVLFNLGNINISERVKEIATIKVLGFHQKETGAYVFRENLLLSLIGMVVGIPIGLVFHHFVMKQIQVEMVSFKVVVKPISVLIAVGMVLVFTIATDLIMRRKINRIEMAESLKSVE